MQDRSLDQSNSSISGKSTGSAATGQSLEANEASLAVVVVARRKWGKASRRKEGVDVDEAVTGLVSRVFVNRLYPFEDQPRCEIQDHLARGLEKRRRPSR